MLQKSTFYKFSLILVTTGYAWIFYSKKISFTGLPSVCIFKKVTGIPCPACGSTRSLLNIMAGEPMAALKLNPLGFLFFIVLIFIPIILFYDFILKKEILWRVYQYTEKRIKEKFILTTLFTLIATNWIWNIMKGL